jgi:enterochelin esterase-like enzyme
MEITETGTEQIGEVMLESIELQSAFLDRTVRIDFYQPDNVQPSAHLSLLLMNDGQDLVKMNFEQQYRSFNENKSLKPLIIAGIHCGTDRKNEYGMSAGPDYKGWGAKAGAYEKFIIDELLPLVNNHFDHLKFTDISFAGFSLGALSAFDIAWNHPEIFSMTGVFSGSLWWRSKDKDHKLYNPWIHRMMHLQVANGDFRPGMKFFFECGEHDEEEDRNKNGVIDSIDDTIDLMRLLVKKGYREGRDIYYLQLPDGRHDVPSWAKALPAFLNWGWGKRN